MVYWVLEANYIRQPVSLLFPPLSSFWNKEKRRKQQGNYLPACSIQLAWRKQQGSYLPACSIQLAWRKQQGNYLPACSIQVAWRKQQGNYLSGCSIQLASDTKISRATKITTLWSKQLICIYSVNSIFIPQSLPLHACDKHFHSLCTKALVLLHVSYKHAACRGKSHGSSTPFQLYPT